MRRPCSSWPTRPLPRPRTRPPPTGETYHGLATGIGISTTTVDRYLRAALELPAAIAPSRAGDRGRPRKGLRHPRRALAADRPGRHELRSGPSLLRRQAPVPQVKVPVIADPAGRLIWAPSPARRAARQRRAREHGIVEAINTAGAQAVADPAYQGGGPAIRVRQVAVAWIRHRLSADVAQPRGGQQRARPAARPRRTSQRRAEELEDPPQIRASPSRTTTLVQLAVQPLFVG